MKNEEEEEEEEKNANGNSGEVGFVSLFLSRMTTSTMLSIMLSIYLSTMLHLSCNNKTAAANESAFDLSSTPSSPELRPDSFDLETRSKNAESRRRRP